VPPGGLGEGAACHQPGHSRLAAAGVVEVDEVAEREERQVLADRHRQREPSLVDIEPPPGLVVDEPEDGAVCEMDGETRSPPAGAACQELAEHRDVRIVVAEDALVERLLHGPDCGCDRTGDGCSDTAHVPIVSQVPEGDSLHRAVQRLQALVGERISVEASNPRARSTGIAEHLDGRVLQGVEARGKHLLLRFEGGYVLRNHLRMSGSWRVLPLAADVSGSPWLVLRGGELQAVLRGGSVLELMDRATRRLGPDILADPPALDAMLANLRAIDQRRELGEALLDQRLVSGIGNLWRAEALWHSRLSPWLRLGSASDGELLSALGEAAQLMRGSLEGRRPERTVYRSAGRPCPRCNATILSRGQGDDNRIAYWCPGCQKESACQRGEELRGA
jgi:endonuclease-8